MKIVLVKFAVVTQLDEEHWTFSNKEELFTDEEDRFLQSELEENITAILKSKYNLNCEQYVKKNIVFIHSQSI